MPLVGTGYVDVQANMSPFNRQVQAAVSTGRLGAIGKQGGAALASGLASAGGKLEAVGSNLKRVGSSAYTTGREMSRALTVPLALVGVAAGKMAIDFEHSMELLHTQAGASQSEVEKLKSSVLALAKTGEHGPTELANALFHLESVGLRGSKAMDALKVAEEGATVGGADLESVTNALAGATQSGVKGTENLHQAMGTLNAIIGQGNLRMEDLVGALSTGILPVAKSFGLSLNDVGAALATMTAKGVPAEAAATRLRMTFSLMAAPTSKAAGVLKELGLTHLDLAHKMRGPEGLVGALTLLKTRLDDFTKDPSKQAALISKMFGGGRSSSAIITLLQNIDDVKKRQDGIVKNSAGFGEALARSQETAAFKIHHAWASIQADLTQIGGQLAPVFADFAGDAAKLVTVFGKLPAPVKEAVVGFGALLAVLGPIALVFGASTRALGSLIGGLGTLSRVLARGLGADIAIKKAGAEVAKSGALGEQAAASFSATAIPAFAAAGAEAGAAFSAAARAEMAVPAALPARGLSAAERQATAGGVILPSGARGATTVEAGATKAAPAVERFTAAEVAATGATGGLVSAVATAPLPFIALAGAVALAGYKIAKSKTSQGLFGGLIDKKTQKLAMEGVAAVRSGLQEITAASQTAQSTLPGIASGEKALSTLRKQGKTDTKAYGLALQNLDALEGQRIQALAARRSAEQKVAEGVRKELLAAEAKLALDRKTHQSDDQLKQDAIQLAQAQSRQQSALANVSRALRGLTPITGSAGTQVGVLLKQLRGVAGFGAFKKLLVTADVSSVDAAIRLVGKLQGLGRQKTALDIIAHSKSPEDALKRLRALLHDIEGRTHKFVVDMQDLARARLVRLKRAIDDLPEHKKLTFEADVRETRTLRRLLQQTGQGSAAKQLSPQFKAMGGRVGKDERLTLVGELGPEIVSLPTGSYVHSNRDSKKIAEDMGIPGFAKGGFVGLTRRLREVFARDEYKNLLSQITESFASDGQPLDLVAPDPLSQQIVQRVTGAQYEKPPTLYQDVVQRPLGGRASADGRRRDSETTVKSSRVERTKESETSFFFRSLRELNRLKETISVESRDRRSHSPSLVGPERLVRRRGRTAEILHHLMGGSMGQAQFAPHPPGREAVRDLQPQSADAKVIAGHVAKSNGAAVSLGFPIPEPSAPKGFVRAALLPAFRSPQDGSEIAAGPIQSFAKGGLVAGGGTQEKRDAALKIGPPAESAGKTASGRSSAEPGIALRDRSTLGKLFDVTVKAHHAVLRHIDWGPASSTGRAIDITGAGARKLGLAKSFPTDAIGDVVQRPEVKRAAGGSIGKEQFALVGERGPEIVQLPVGSFVHKNSDSKQIAKHLDIPGFAKGGVVGSKKKKPQFPAFGKTPRKKIPVAEAVATAHQLWPPTSPFLHAAGMPMPRVRFSSVEFPEIITTQNKEGLTYTIGPPSFAKALADKKSEGIRAMVHEWAHVFQLDPKNYSQTEGGAEGFARIVAPQVAASLGIPFTQPEREPFRHQLHRLANRRGGGKKYEDFVLNRQFGYHSTGQQTKALKKEKASEKDLPGGLWYQVGSLPPPKGKRRKGTQPTAGASESTVGSLWSAFKDLIPPNVRFKPNFSITDDPHRSEQQTTKGAPSQYLPRATRGQIWFPRWAWNDIFGGADGSDYTRWAKTSFVHEHVHGVQSLDTLKTRREAEGGAVLFSEKYVDQLMGAGSLYRASGGYRSYANQMAKRGDDWMMHGQFEPDPVKKKRKKKTGDGKTGGAGVPRKTGIVPALGQLIGLVRKEYPALKVTSTTGGGHVDGSLHYQGKAADFADGAQTMFRASEWLKTSGLSKSLLEGIHNPNLSIADGKHVAVGYWGKEWPLHKDHIHLAADHILASAKGKAAKPKRITGKLTLGQLVSLAKKVGFPDPALAASVAYAESRGDINAVGDHGTSFGLWQIHKPDHKQYNEDKLKSDIFYNARAALAISGHGKNWKPWSTFNHGDYKQFLGGRATPLPKPGGGAAKGDSFADYLAMKLELASDEVTSPGKADDLKWINKALRYWRGVLRRNKAAGNSARVTEAHQQIVDLRTKKKDLRTPPEGSVFDLAGLTTIGKVNIAGLQGTLDQIDLDVANASLTETLDAAGNVTPASFADDIAALQHAVTVRGDIYNLAKGMWLEEQAPEESSKGPKVHALNNGQYAVTVGKKTYTFSGTPGQEITVGGKKVRIPGGKPGVRRYWNQGTRAQQTLAATDFKSAKDALKSVQDEAKSEDVSTGTSGDGGGVTGEFKSFLSSLTDILKTSLSNIRPLPSFAKGGVLKHSLALVGEQGYELAKLPGGKGMVPLGQKGPEIRPLPVGTQIFSHPESKRIAKDMGIPAFAQGGVIQPMQSPDGSLLHALERLEKALKDSGGKTVNIDARPEFKEQTNPHAFSEELAFRLKAAM